MSHAKGNIDGTPHRPKIALCQPGGGRQSKSQPFCDGSHKGSAVTPVKYRAEETKTVYFCGCKHSAAKPLCDGIHKALA